MQYLLPLATLATVQLLAVISPGQSFVLISKLALSDGRKTALMATFGIGVGSIIWAGAAIAGLAIVLQQAAWLYAVLKLCGGAYLLWLAIQIWRQAPEKSDNGQPSSAGRKTSLSRAFRLGVTTQLANPKVVVFFGSIFFALLPDHAPAWVLGASIAIVFCNESLWFATVALLFSSDRPRAFYFRAKLWIDRVMACLLGAIGARLAWESIDLFAGRKSS